MALTNEEEIEAIIRIARQLKDVIVDTVREAGPMGAPSRSVYYALRPRIRGTVAHGCTLSPFRRLMDDLVDEGRLTKHGQCYRVAGEG